MIRRNLAIVGASLLVSVSSYGAAYTQNFDVDSTATWIVNKGPVTTDAATNFFFDYSTVGIPAAPKGGSSRGMKLQANQSSGVFGGVSVSPMGLNVSGDYVMTFDWWSNVNGPFPAGGSGSTQLSTFGIGTAGATAVWPGATAAAQDAAWFAATGDGNSASDWRAYSSAAPTSYTEASGVYAAGNTTGVRNSSNAYYASFGAVSAPAAQTLLFPQQTGVTGIGSAGMEWHEVEIAKLGNAITWKVDGLLIATINASTITLGGGNVFFGHADTNATSSTDVNDVNLLFTLIDNVSVQVPEPSAMALLVPAAAVMMRRRK